MHFIAGMDSGWLQRGNGTCITSARTLPAWTGARQKGISNLLDVLSALFVSSGFSAAGGNEKDSTRAKYDTVDVYGSNSIKPKSVLFLSFPDSSYPSLTGMDSDRSWIPHW